jgi:hypothetical protein
LVVYLSLSRLNVLQKFDFRQQFFVLGNVEQDGGTPALLRDNERTLGALNLLNERSGIGAKFRNRFHILI